jgi:hypothetical protein
MYLYIYVYQFPSQTTHMSAVYEDLDDFVVDRTAIAIDRSSPVGHGRFGSVRKGFVSKDASQANVVVKMLPGKIVVRQLQDSTVGIYDQP